MQSDVTLTGLDWSINIKIFRIRTIRIMDDQDHGRSPIKVGTGGTEDGSVSWEPFSLSNQHNVREPVAKINVID